MRRWRPSGPWHSRPDWRFTACSSLRDRRGWPSASSLNGCRSRIRRSARIWASSVRPALSSIRGKVAASAVARTLGAWTHCLPTSPRIAARGMVHVLPFEPARPSFLPEPQRVRHSLVSVNGVDSPRPGHPDGRCDPAVASGDHGGAGRASSPEEILVASMSAAHRAWARPEWVASVRVEACTRGIGPRHVAASRENPCALRVRLA